MMSKICFQIGYQKYVVHTHNKDGDMYVNKDWIKVVGTFVVILLFFQLFLRIQNSQWKVSRNDFKDITASWNVLSWYLLN